jgi:hypothetical protein
LLEWAGPHLFFVAEWASFSTEAAEQVWMVARPFLFSPAPRQWYGDHNEGTPRRTVQHVLGVSDAHERRLNSRRQPEQEAGLQLQENHIPSASQGCLVVW